MMLYLQKISFAPDGTTGETTSHPTKQPKNGCQVVGYSHSPRLTNNASQVAGYAVAAAMGACGHCIQNISQLSPGLQAPLHTIHTVFFWPRAKIEQNIFTFWSSP